MKFLRNFLIFAVLVSICGVTHSEPAKRVPRTKEYRRRYAEVNQIKLPISNFGEMGYRGYNEWPKGTGESYVFDMGIWIGTMKDGMPQVSCGYDFMACETDMCPGPPGHVADYDAQGFGAHEEDSLYFSSGISSEEEWTEITGNCSEISIEDMWCEFNDMWDDRHNWEPRTAPLGLHIRQTVFGWNAPVYENMLFVLYEIENASEEKLEDLYAAYACDMDIGDESGTFANDLLGCDIGRSLGWTYQETQEAGWSAPPPYYVGVRFFRGPRADDTVFVSCHPDSAGYPDAYSDTVLPGSTLVMTSFNKCNRGDASDEMRRYRLISGHHWETGDYDPWRIEDTAPGDKRMLLGCGPFDLESGEVDSFLVVFMFSNGNKGGLDYLLLEGDVSYDLYKRDWVVAGPPPSPELTATPGDREVTLIWNNSPEYYRDPYIYILRDTALVAPADTDTVYVEYDFEGYRLWKSATGRADDWEELGQWDINNNIILLPGDKLICGEQDTLTASGKRSSNKGLVHSYVDTNVMNGMTYHYAVTSFDFNTRGYYQNESNIWVSMESGKKEVLVQPRAEVNNHVPAETGDSLLHISGLANTLGNLRVDVIGDIAVTGHDYELHWGRIKESIDTLPVYTYNVWDVDSGVYLFGTGTYQLVTYPLSSPHPYPDVYDRTWIISRDAASVAVCSMRVHFDSINTVSNSDCIYVYDKLDSLIAQYSGAQGDFWTPLIPGNTVKITFRTNSDTFNGYGFDIDKYEYCEPELEVLPARDSIFAVTEREDSTITIDHDVSVGDSIRYIIQTVVFDTIRYDSTWLWAAKLARAFEGLMISGNIYVPVQSRHQELRNMTSRRLLTIRPDPWGEWRDTTVKEIREIKRYEFDKLSTYLDEPDSVIVVTDVGSHTFEGNLTVEGFYSSRILSDLWPYKNRWAYHGRTNIEIQWENHLGSSDSVTMRVFDKSTGMEIPYDSDFGDNWCFTDTAGFGKYKPGSRFLTAGQPNSCRQAFYVAGVCYKFNAWSYMDWDKRPDTGDIWEIISSPVDDRVIPTIFIDTFTVVADTIVDRVAISVDTTADSLVFTDTTIISEEIFIETTVVVSSILPTRGNRLAFGTSRFEYTDQKFDMSAIKVVPNPYFVRARWDRSTDVRKIEFAHLPSVCTIRIYTLDGVLVRKLEHDAAANPAVGGARSWDLLTRNEQHVASGIYIYHVSTPQGHEKLGKFAVIR